MLVRFPFLAVSSPRFIPSLRFILNPESVFYTQSVVRSPQSAVRSPQSVVRSPQSAVHSPQSAVRSPYFILTGFEFGVLQNTPAVFYLR